MELKLTTEKHFLNHFTNQITTTKGVTNSKL